MDCGRGNARDAKIWLHRSASFHLPRISFVRAKFSQTPEKQPRIQGRALISINGAPGVPARPVVCCEGVGRKRPEIHWFYSWPPQSQSKCLLSVTSQSPKVVVEKCAEALVCQQQS